MSADRSTCEARPLSDPAREAYARQLRAEGLSPEEWAARYAHTIACSSLDTVRYLDTELDLWIQEVHRILRSGALLRELRARYLTAEERKAIDDEDEL